MPVALQDTVLLRLLMVLLAVNWLIALAGQKTATKLRAMFVNVQPQATVAMVQQEDMAVIFVLEVVVQVALPVALVLVQAKKIVQPKLLLIPMAAIRLTPLVM
jgi:hypothetical protein